MKTKIVYIAHPIGGDVENNLKDLARILRVININSNNTPDSTRIVPVATYYADVISLEDSNEIERKIGITNSEILIKTGVFDELWLTGKYISEGMRNEILLFSNIGKPVVNYINKI